MTDPEPQVFFLNFGSSTLDHELRLYVRELRDRSYTVDELNRAIDKLCRENDINIAFNQLDVYLHKPDGTEVQEISRPIEATSLPATQSMLESQNLIYPDLPGFSDIRAPTISHYG